MKRSRAVTIASAAVLAGVLALHVFSMIARLDRGPNQDEVEYLHVSWRMAQGDALYETFFEHHSPLFFAMFVPFAPEELGDFLPYLENARILAGLAGLATLCFFAAILWRLAPEAAAIGTGLVYATGLIWGRTLNESRAEPFAAMVLFGAIALILLPRRPSPILPGLAIGLLFLSVMLNPKWPLVTFVAGCFALERLVRCGRDAWKGLAVAVLLIGATVAGIAAMVPLDRWFFFNFELNRSMYAWIGTAPDFGAEFRELPGFANAPRFFQPLVMLPAVVLVASCLARDPRVRRPVLLLLIGFLAAVTEVRFLYTYPYVLAHYFMMWSLFAAALLGLAPLAVAACAPRLLRSDSLRVAVTQLVVFFGLALTAMHAVAVTEWATTDRSPFWTWQRSMTQRMRPGDTVWLGTHVHPVTVRDATYYWIGANRLVPLLPMFQSRFLPPPVDLPICAIERGNPARLRFVSSPGEIRALTSEVACFQRLVAAGRLRRTAVPRVYEVVPADVR